MLPPKLNEQTNCKCNTIGCESFMITALKKHEGYYECILKCPKCGYEETDVEVAMPILRSVKQGNCPLEIIDDIDYIIEGTKCVICGDTTVTFVYPENMQRSKSMKKFACCQTFTCYLKLVKQLTEE